MAQGQTLIHHSDAASSSSNLAQINSGRRQEASERSSLFILPILQGHCILINITVNEPMSAKWLSFNHHNRFLHQQFPLVALLVKLLNCKWKHAGRNTMCTIQSLSRKHTVTEWSGVHNITQYIAKNIKQGCCTMLLKWASECGDCLLVNKLCCYWQAITDENAIL